MSAIHLGLIGLVLKLYPRAFRDRFEAEIRSAYLDQRESFATSVSASRLGSTRVLAVTLLGLIRSIIPVHLQERKRTRQIGRFHARPESLMQHIISDIRQALRRFRSQPGFTAVAVLTLALGLGANTSVFSVLNGVILSPLPYNEPERLVRLYANSSDDPGARQYMTGLDILDVRGEVRSFSSVGISYTYRSVGGDLLPEGGTPVRIRILPVSADYFRTLRATPLLGRTFTTNEELPGARLVVLSHGLWASFASSDPAIVGKNIVISGESYEVIGVMRPTFVDVMAGDVEAWTPTDLTPEGRNSRYNSYLSAFARLAPGVSLEQARQEVSALMTRLAERFPDTNEGRGMRVEPLRSDVVGDAASAVYVLMGAAGFVLLIACLNVANLFVARGMSESRETAVRTALGASRSRLVGERLVESIVIAVAGGVVGVFVGHLGVRALIAVSPDSLPRAESVGIDGTLMLFAVGATLLTGVVFGAWPALRASLADPGDALHEASRGNSSGRGSRSARNILVASQVSLALVLLFGAGVLMRSFAARQNVQLGITSQGVATFEINLPESQYGQGDERIQLHHTLTDRLRALPGVVAVGATSWLPANGEYHHWGYSFTDDGGERRSFGANARIVSGDFFKALDIPLLKGRYFEPNDRSDTTLYAIVSSSLATAAYGSADPIGKTFGFGSGTHTIVGVARDVAISADGTGHNVVYINHDQYANDRNWSLTYVVRSAVPADQLIGPAREALRSIDPALVLHQPRALEKILATHHARARFTLLLLATFAAVAVCLAAVGVYGVLSYSVAQRTREIGVRLALGARPSQLRADVVKQGLKLGGGGMLVGLVGALALSRVLASLAFGVSIRDPLVFAIAITTLALVVLAASYIPARRATRVEPSESLRD